MNNTEKELNKLFDTMEEDVALSHMLSREYLKQLQALVQKGEREVVEKIDERIMACELLIEEYEKGNDLNGGDIDSSLDHEQSVKIAMESLREDLLIINKKNDK